MRFLFIDRITRFKNKDTIGGITICPRTLSYPAERPDGPGPAPSLLIEILAQAGGWLIQASWNFEFLGIMTIIEEFHFHGKIPRAGVLNFEVNLKKVTEDMVLMGGKIFDSRDDLVASVECIKYVLVPFGERGSLWSRQVWEVLRGARTLRTIEKLQ